MRRFSLTQRLFVLAAVALFPTIAILIFNVVELRQSREREAHDMACRTGQMAQLELERIVSGIESVLIALARAPVVRSFNDVDCGAYLHDVDQALPQVDVITVIDIEGTLRCPKGVVNSNRSDRSYFTEVMRTGRFAVGEFTVSRTSGRRTLPIAPVRNEAARWSAPRFDRTGGIADKA